MPHDFVFDKKISDLIERPSTIAAKFVERGIVALRGHEYTEEDLLNLAAKIGEITGGFTPGVRAKPTDPVGNSWRYHQVHDQQISWYIEADENSTEIDLIQWHLEGVSLRNSQRASIWHMYHFTAEKGTGNTGFVDMQMIVDQLPEHYKSFLESATIIHFPNWQHQPDSFDEFRSTFQSKVDHGRDVVWTADGPTYVASFARKAIEINPNTGKPTLRVCPCCVANGPQDFVTRVNGHPASETDRALFREIFQWVKENVERTESNQIWWAWEQGDAVIPDLYRMAHGVKAGFEPGQRSFWGYWCYPFGTPAEPSDTISEEEYGKYLADLGL